MTLAFSIDSQTFMPWNETGYSFTNKKNAGDETEELATCCFYPGRSSSVAPSDGVHTQADGTVTFALDAVTFTPKVRDILTTPEGSELVVLSVQESRMLRYWSCVVRDLVLAYDLRQTATLKRQASSPSTDGIRGANLGLLQSNVPCRMQAETIEMRFDDGRVNNITRYRCFIGVDIQLAAGDVIEVDGVIYEVLEQSVGQFDRLTTATCERRS